MQKVLLIGDPESGKTSWLKWKVSREVRYQPRYVPTIGCDVNNIIENGREFSVWDTAGHEKFGRLKYGYYIGADIFILVCHNFEDTKTTILEECSKYGVEVKPTARFVHCLPRNIPDDVLTLEV